MAQISSGYASQVLGHVLTLLDQRGFLERSLEPMLGRDFRVHVEPRGLISVRLTRSQAYTREENLAYIADDEAGVPFELRVNKLLGYAQVIVKGQFRLPGYEVFSSDHFGNYAQERRIRTANARAIQRDLLVPLRTALLPN